MADTEDLELTATTIYLEESLFVARSIINKASVQLLLGVSMLAMVGTWIYVEKKLSPNANDAKLHELIALASATPEHPGWIETGTHNTSKASLAGVSKYYKSDAEYSGVSRFYTRELTKEGWQFVGERRFKDWWRDLGGREISFLRGEYKITITFAGESADYGWQYAIYFGWEK